MFTAYYGLMDQLACVFYARHEYCSFLCFIFFRLQISIELYILDLLLYPSGSRTRFFISALMAYSFY